MGGRQLHQYINKLHYYGELAHLGEHLPCKQEVTGSSPVFSTIFPLAQGKSVGGLNAYDIGSNPIWEEFVMSFSRVSVKFVFGFGL